MSIGTTLLACNLYNMKYVLKFAFHGFIVKERDFYEIVRKTLNNSEVMNAFVEATSKVIESLHNLNEALRNSELGEEAK